MRSEADVRCELITPLLRKVAHSIYTVAAPDSSEGGSTFSSLLNVETKTEGRLHSPGAKPRVDYTLMGYVREKPIYCIPVEAKKAMITKDMSQLAQYMCTLGLKGEYLASNICIGFLMDEHHLRLAFAPFCLNDGLLLPIVLFSPVLKWHEDTSIRRGVCVAMCLLQQFSVKCVALTPSELEGLVGQGLKDGIIQEAKTLMKEPVSITPDSGVMFNFVRELEVLKLKVEVLEAHVAVPVFCSLCASPLKRRREF